MNPTAAPARRVLVFARAPVPGRCKTRLIGRLGARGAARLQAQLCLRTLATASVAAATVELWGAPDARHGFFHACRRRFGVVLRRQPAGDLGRRMEHALRDALARGADAAVLVGTDCPALSPADVDAAFAALAGGADCVLQPATDGGYVLIGARQLPAGVLRDIDWSSGRELAQTRRRLARAGLRVAELRPLWDIDHPADRHRALREDLLP